MKKYFITYGDNRFKYSKIHLGHLAKSSQFFDEILLLGPNDLSTQFKIDYKNLLLKTRGAGYWVWKFEIIKNLLEEVNENDIIFYCDAGSSINNLPKARNRFLDYLNIIEDKAVNFLRFETEKKFLEKNYTSKQLFSVLNLPINSKIGNSTQLQAGVMFFKKNKINSEFIEECFKIINIDHELLTDKYNKGQIKTFVECRHDQSLFSILGKHYNSYILENETEFRDRKNLQFDFPILTVRASNHGLKDKIKLKYFLGVYGKKTKFFI